ncbi:DUF1059 domain-containing protein [Jeongeupia chitinilytica]|uniref:DUF1059 domain-containing protein n=1 Tax=Jeongeupia chitinilytica TaxID=1041641 RepID=A0ABQ3H3H0_9NEIS|nr:DUF1059 domain-containing protein [Jeongeupia chitinilytica]GHD63181.1 hypothetical protein GCM10007350_20110 [Jeongeupia chitinilytica]
MSRKYIDCRDYPGSTCSVKISADTEAELLEATIEHAVKAHGHQDTPELRAQLAAMFKDDTGNADTRLAA